MDISALQKVKDAISRNEEVAIAVGKNPDIDAMGAALSLYLALKASGKKISIASPTDAIVELSSLVGIDKVKTYFEKEGGDLIVSFPYTEGEIEKVSYTLEEGFLNIIVKAGEKGLNFSEKDVNYKRGGASGKGLFITVGTPRLSDLGSLFDTEALKGATVINIDNKIDNQGFGDIVLVSPVASSVSELLSELISYLEFPLDIDIAQNLLSGISFATDNFQNSKTSATAFEMAALFIKKGAVRQKPVLEKAPVDGSFFSTPPLSQAPQRRFPSQPSLSPSEDLGSQFPFPQRPAQVRPNINQSQPRGQTSFPQSSFPSTQRDPFAAQKDRSRFRPARPQQQPVQQPSFSKSNAPVAPQTLETKDDKTEEAPPDWLAPKVYKGSTLV